MNKVDKIKEFCKKNIRELCRIKYDLVGDKYIPRFIKLPENQMIENRGYNEAIADILVYISELKQNIK